ncbi:hypothetical protein AADZ91_04825 [Colwelliaceae bacterium 6441]
MLKGRSKAIVYSLLTHAVIFWLISQTVTIPAKKNEIKPKAIQSFLYTPPAKEITPTEDTSKEVTETIKAVEITQKDVSEKPSSASNVQDITQAPETALSPEALKIHKEDEPLTTVKPKSKFSAYGQLKNLSERLNDDFFKQENIELNTPNTGSVMHGKPTLVPHSAKQLTSEEIKKTTSKQISSDMVITKGDDGSCSIERDLSVVGIEGVKSVEGFACGKSKFDKSFSDHMKKVRTKLGK